MLEVFVVDDVRATPMSIKLATYKKEQARLARRLKVIAKRVGATYQGEGSISKLMQMIAEEKVLLYPALGKDEK